MLLLFSMFLICTRKVINLAVTKQKNIYAKNLSRLSRTGYKYKNPNPKNVSDENLEILFVNIIITLIDRNKTHLFWVVSIFYNFPPWIDITWSWQGFPIRNWKICFLFSLLGSDMSPEPFTFPFVHLECRLLNCKYGMMNEDIKRRESDPMFSVYVTQDGFVHT